MKKYEIVNKVFQKKKGKLSFLKILIDIFLILIVLILIFQLAVGEKFGDVIKTVALPILLGLYARSRVKESGYESVALEFTIQPGELVMRYPAIDRMDRGGIREEVITLEQNRITQIMYSDELKSIRILGRAMMKVWYVKEQRWAEIDEINNNHDSEYIVYLPTEQCKEILGEIEANLNIKVNQVD